MTQKTYSDKWKDRFDFFERNGLPGSPGYRDAIKKLKFLQRPRYMYNFYAFFFGFIYFCILGLWKKGLTLFIGIAVINLLLGVIEVAGDVNLEGIVRGVNLAYAAFCAMSVNSAYYLHTIKGIDSWNPFQGMSRKSSAELEKIPSRQY
ncbi:DUF2628 domain-containing protein [Superficieibacter sp. 1612_C1]|uniref:DUF2628 domain-containing protein n=1 Tax=Superficieibacter sp. 1612_C1 TaxID=2780382 RepID=UPI0018832025|nr:DUF2628 domain-containing protein [Superficieibacter sp. 1612_C1]